MDKVVSVLKKLFLLVTLLIMTTLLSSCRGRSLKKYSDDKAYQLGIKMLNLINRKEAGNAQLFIHAEDEEIINSLINFEKKQGNDDDIYINDMIRKRNYLYSDGFMYVYKDNEIIKKETMTEKEFKKNYMGIRRHFINQDWISDHSFTVNKIDYAWGTYEYKMDHTFYFKEGYEYSFIYLNKQYTMLVESLSFTSTKKHLDDWIILKGKIDMNEKTYHIQYSFSTRISYNIQIDS